VNRDPYVAKFHNLSGSQLQNRLLTELDDLLLEIEDGTVKEDTFTGCIALGDKNLPHLNENQSGEICKILSRKPKAHIQLVETGFKSPCLVFPHG